MKLARADQRKARAETVGPLGEQSANLRTAGTTLNTSARLFTLARAAHHTVVWPVFCVYCLFP